MERQNLDENFLDPMLIDSHTVNKGIPLKKSDRKTIKLNEKMLRRASATVDLISQKAQSKNMIQETISAAFVTNVIELTNDALRMISNQSGDPDDPDNLFLITDDSEQCQKLDLNLRFIKPSQSFYSHVMSLWFKYLNLI